MNNTPKTRIEWCLSKILDSLGLRHECNVRLYGYEVDALLLEYPLALEADGEQWHGPERQLYDQARDHYLAAKGYQVIRFPGKELLKGQPKVRMKILMTVLAVKFATVRTEMKNRTRRPNSGVFEVNC